MTLEQIELTVFINNKKVIATYRPRILILINKSGVNLTQSEIDHLDNFFTNNFKDLKLLC